MKTSRFASFSLVAIVSVLLFGCSALSPERIAYKVTYVENGYTGGTVPVDTNAYLPGANVTVLGNTGNIEKSGCTFAGWNTASDGGGTDRTPGSTFVMGSADVVHYAKWATSPTRTLTYDGNGLTGGTVPVDANAYLPGAIVSVLGNTGTIAKSGYTFIGWNTASDGSGADRAAGSTFTMGSANVVLYAKWTTSPTYTLTYSGNGSTGGSIPVDSNAYLSNTVVTVMGNTGNLAKTGYTFAGWNTASNGSGADRAAGSTFTMGSANVVLYAKWTTSPTYTLTYSGNGSTGGSVPADSNAYLSGAAVTVSGNTGNLGLFGYIFVGWNTAPNGGGTDRAVGSTFTMGSANVILYAKFALGYKVTYHGNGNTGGSVPVDGNLYLPGATVTVLATGNITKQGYRLLGWNTASDGSGTNRAWQSTFTLGSGGADLYANWAATYSVTYGGNGATGGFAPSTYSYLPGETITVSGNIGNLVKPDCTLVGWNTASDGSGIDWAPGSTLTVGSANVALYAKWIASWQLGNTGPAGGIVFYDKGSFSDGWRFLEADTVDLSTSATWGNGVFGHTGSSGEVAGTGKGNTALIVGLLGAGTYAARMCDDLVKGGFNDWFLPSADELELMIYYIATHYPTSPVRIRTYWSSTETTNEPYALFSYFSGGYVVTTSDLKMYGNAVRAIRSF